MLVDNTTWFPPFVTCGCSLPECREKGCRAYRQQIDDRAAEARREADRRRLRDMMFRSLKPRIRVKAGRAPA